MENILSSDQKGFTNNFDGVCLIELRADQQLHRILWNVGATIILSTWREELGGDPIIAEDAALRKKLLNP